jgi:hypothetical protein
MKRKEGMKGIPVAVEAAESSAAAQIHLVSHCIASFGDDEQYLYLILANLGGQIAYHIVHIVHMAFQSEDELFGPKN